MDEMDDNSGLWDASIWQFQQQHSADFLINSLPLQRFWVDRHVAWAAWGHTQGPLGLPPQLARPGEAKNQSPCAPGPR